jgi:hydrogenase nickel incorporation protein HypA/HybF
MHETALARDLLESVERSLGTDNARIVRLDIRIGSASGIMAHALRFAFEVLAEGTRAEGAELAIVFVSARSRCGNCGILFQFEGMIGRCPACQQLGGELVSGDEIILNAIEVSDV